MYAIKAVYDGTNFKPIQPITIKEEYEVIITFVEPVKKVSGHIKESTKVSRSSLKGLLKDKVWMANDFNEPIDEMKEYME